MKIARVPQPQGLQSMFPQIDLPCLKGWKDLRRQNGHILQLKQGVTALSSSPVGVVGVWHSVMTSHYSTNEQQHMKQPHECGVWPEVFFSTLQKHMAKDKQLSRCSCANPSA
jgi:hypothetical protein